MSLLLEWMRNLVGTGPAQREGGFRAPSRVGDDNMPIEPDLDDALESEVARLQVRALRKEELLAALKSEQLCREELLSIKRVIRKHKRDRDGLLSEKEKLSHLLRKFQAGSDVEKLNQITKILSDDLPESISVIESTIAKYKATTKRIETELQRIADERRQIVARYMKTFKAGESPDLEDLPTELIFERQESKGARERLEGEEALWGDGDSDLEISDGEVEDEDEILDIPDSDDEKADDDTKRTPLADRKF